MIGPTCNSRRDNRTSIRCDLPVLHDGDHEHGELRWHPRRPHIVGYVAEAEEPAVPVTKQDIARALGSALIIPEEAQ